MNILKTIIVKVIETPNCVFIDWTVKTVLRSYIGKTHLLAKTIYLFSILEYYMLPIKKIWMDVWEPLENNKY